MSNAIPTRYAGVQFRSRLEAKWAAFFDLHGWPWEYEPFDLNGYIPDFLLQFKKPMIVEVKPFVGSPFDWETPEHDAVLEKIRASGWQGEGLLVGATMWSGQFAMGYCERGEAINPGLLFDCKLSIAPDHAVLPVDDNGPGIGVYANAFGFKECCGGPVDVVGYFQCRRCGDHDKGPTLQDSEIINREWREAGNRVQWKSPRRMR